MNPNPALFVHSSPITGKSFSDALILASTKPQYDKRLFIDLPVQYMKNYKLSGLVDPRISASDKDLPVCK